MTTGLEFGKDYLPIHADLKTASIGWNYGYAIDPLFKMVQQGLYQAHGPVAIVSHFTVNNFDLHFICIQKMFSKIILLLP
jgi:hypothetical protein